MADKPVVGWATQSPGLPQKFHLLDRVLIKQSGSAPHWAKDWKGAILIITAVEVDPFNIGRVRYNFTLACRPYQQHEFLNEDWLEAIP